MRLRTAAPIVVVVTALAVAGVVVGAWDLRDDETIPVQEVGHVGLPPPGSILVLSVPPDVTDESAQRAIAVTWERLRFFYTEMHVTSVTARRYNVVMCGLQSHDLDDDSEVWVVAIAGAPRKDPGSSFAILPMPPTAAVVVEKASGVSRQIFGPWPLPRDPNGHCET